MNMFRGKLPVLFQESHVKALEAALLWGLCAQDLGVELLSLEMEVTPWSGFKKSGEVP